MKLQPECVSQIAEIIFRTRSNVPVSYTHLMYNYYSKMYSMYGMQMPSETYDKEGDDGKTTGETFKEQSLDTIEKELLMRQHAEEYGISLTDEEKQQAKEAAQAFADKNGDDVMKKLHATVEDIQDALELYVIQTKIYDPIIANVDTEVSDEEAKQTSISYITVSLSLIHISN